MPRALIGPLSDLLYIKTMTHFAVLHRGGGGGAEARGPWQQIDVDYRNLYFAAVGLDVVTSS